MLLDSHQLVLLFSLFSELIEVERQRVEVILSRLATGHRLKKINRREDSNPGSNSLPPLYMNPG